MVLIVWSQSFEEDVKTAFDAGQEVTLKFATEADADTFSLVNHELSVSKVVLSGLDLTEFKDLRSSLIEISALKPQTIEMDDCKFANDLIDSFIPVELTCVRMWSFKRCGLTGSMAKHLINVLGSPTFFASLLSVDLTENGLGSTTLASTDARFDGASILL